MVEAGDEETLRVVLLGLETDTGTTLVIGGPFFVLMIDTNIDIISFVLDQTTGKCVFAAFVVDEAQVGIVSAPPALNVLVSTR